MVKAVGATRNIVTIDAKGVVLVVMHGKQDAAAVQALGVELDDAANEVREQGKRPVMLMDLTHLNPSDSDSSGRTESKRLILNLSYEAVALFGGTSFTMSILTYLLRVTKTRLQIRYFKKERDARRWLENTRHPKVYRNSTGLVAGISITLIGLLALVGWFINNEHFIRWLSSLAPMNPVAAVGLLIMGYGFCAYWAGKLKQLKIVGIFGIVLGLAALLPLHLDHLLFTSKVIAGGAHSDLADSAAVCFIAIGITPFTVGTKKLIVRVLQYILAAVVIGLCLFNMFGQLYAHDFLMGLTPSFVMAFNLAAAFLIAGVALVLLVLYRQMGNVLIGVARIGWLIMMVLIFVQIATYGAWSQSVSRNMAASSQAFIAKSNDMSEHITQHIQAYVATLRGFKGLFVSSDYVDQGEFQSYYDSLELTKNYPGLRALSFISKVPDAQVPAFTKLHQTDNSLYLDGNPTFAITNKTDLPVHYVVTYNATSKTNTGLGSDLGSNPSRLTTFQKADAVNAPVASGTLLLGGTNGTPAVDGFFITTPVSSKSSDPQNVGFVNAVFAYSDFFGESLSSDASGLAIRVSDTGSNGPIYSSQLIHSSKDVGFSSLVRTPVADRTWAVSIAAPSDYGIDSGQKNLPLIILVGGQLFSILLVFIFVLLARARRQGYELADSITQDLENERNTAVANDQKSGAILSSIGDAVFAINTEGVITLFNPSAQRVSGLAKEEVIGKLYKDVLHFEHEQTGRANDSFVRQALSGHLATMANHTVLVRKDGSRVQVADSAAPIRDSKNKIIGAIIVFRDVSKDYELDKAKTEFVSLASHQLRTPLSAINWYGEMLLSGDAGKLNKDQQEYIKEIFEGSQRMVALVSSLLDVSRLEVGKLVNKPEPTNVQSIINDLEKELAAVVQTKGLNIVKHIEKLPPVIADSKQLRMIVQNLMSNAVKYTSEKGVIEITLHKATAKERATAGTTRTGDQWFFSVKDNGYGIPKDQQSKIFGKLFRADNVRKLDVEGTGLGLYIVKQVVEKMGGKVWFESIEGAGTTFYVVAPFGKEK